MTALVGTLDVAAERYVDDLAVRLERALDGVLTGVWLIGSAARNDYIPWASDLDVAVAVTRPLLRYEAAAVVSRCRHDSLPCPTKGLELVVYEPRRAPAYELNLNDGPRLAFHVSTRPFEDDWHWFVVDLSAAREAARTLVGPAFGDVFAPLPQRDVRRALREVLDWQEQHEPARPNSVLNACRALRYASERVWSSKSEAATWARDHDPELIDLALERRRDPADASSLDEARVRRLLALAREALS